MSLTKLPVYIPFLILATLAVVLVSEHVFFWDTIQLGSKHAHWYFEQNFSTLLLPEEIDSGHPPVFGMYLALCWMLFGKSLLVSHLSMLPFVWGTVWGTYQLGKYYGDSRVAMLLLLFLLVDPTVAAQHILVSPDAVICCFFINAWYAILTKKGVLKALMLFGMASISMRGMMIVAGLYLFDVLLTLLALHTRQTRFKREFNSKFCLLVFFRKSLFYIPAGLAALTFLIWHYQATGWIGYHTDSTWAPSFVKVDLAGFLKNIVILVWRLFDFGRFTVWLVIGGLTFWAWIKSREEYFKQADFFWKNHKLQQLYVLGGALFLVLTPSFLLHQHLTAHRYLLPLLVWASVLVYYLIINYLKNKKWYRGVVALIIISLFLGNFWIYPPSISQGWDSSLAHLPHYELRTEVLDFFNEKRIPLKQVGTAFPEIGALKYKDLSEREDGMVTKDLTRNQYIYYSNVMNEFSDAELIELTRNWQILQRWEDRGVVAIVYARKE